MNYLSGENLKNLILASAEGVSKNKEILNRLNVFPVPDGDTGVNMSLTLQGAANKLGKMNIPPLSLVAKTVAQETLMGARGCSGIILSQWFKGFALSVGEKSKIDSQELSLALNEAARTAYQSVEKPVEGTVLTVMRDCAKKALADDKEEIIKIFEKVVSSAKESLSQTPELLPLLAQAGIVDAGGQGFVFMLEAMISSLRGERINTSPPVPIAQRLWQAVKVGKESLVNKYCVECVIQGENSKLEEIRKGLERYGSSLILAKSGELLRVHIHSDKPKKVLRYCQTVGNLLQPKVSNMKKQARGFLKSAPLLETQKEIGIVAVTLGKGLAKIFKSLGADIVIRGRRTMNPATIEIVKAIREFSAKNIIFLPNNNNVLPVAKEAVRILSQEVRVIPTCTIPQGIAALLSFNAEDSFQNNVNHMLKAIDKVRSGMVTYALEPGKFENISFEKGDILGFWEEKIKVVGKDLSQTVMDLLTQEVKNEDGLITIYYGESIRKKERGNLSRSIKDKYPGIELELHYGGQPHYHYIISLE